MSKKTGLLIAFILAKFVLQYLLVNPDYELHRDEFLHLDQANHLAWGYISVPPVTAWISSIIRFLGNSPFWIRFFPALFGAMTIVVIWKTIEALKGNLFAMVTGATCVLFSALLRLNILYQPTSLDVLCWAGFGYVLIKYISTENNKWFYVGTVVLALGFLNKYNIIFLLAGLFPALLLTRPSLFRNKHFWFSALLFLLLILPNLIWQYNNDFPVYHHMRVLAETQLVNVNRLDFLKEQLLYFTGALVVLIAGLYALLFYNPFRKYRFFFWALCFTLTIFTYLKAKGYYAMGLYPVYIAFGAVYLETSLQTGWRKILRPVLILLPLIFFIPMYRILFPNKSPEYVLSHAALYKKYGLLRWEDGKDHALPQDYADMLGWMELARKTDSVFATLTDQEHTLILCDNYGQAGAINYYTKNKNIYATTFNADYINWFHLDIKYRHLIRIKSLEGAGNEMNETASFFEKSYLAGTITNPFARETGTSIFVFEYAKTDINQRIRKEIEEVKDYQ